MSARAVSVVAPQRQLSDAERAHAAARVTPVQTTVTVVLGPDRFVRVSAARASDIAELSRWQADDDSITSIRRVQLIADVAALIAAGNDDPANHAVLVGEGRGGGLVAVGAYRRSHDDAATAVCEVNRRYQNLGLGTFLLRRLAEIALGHEIHRFRIDVTANSESLMDVLRDCGLCSSWDLGLVSHVELDLAHTRPGWSTPECQTVSTECPRDESCAPAACAMTSLTPFAAADF
jgi:Acetyltransferase (GNAT) family